MQLCSHPRCDFPVAGVGEPYGLCVQHGHEERNRRLRERDAQARAAAPPAPLRPNLSPTLPRPLSAVIGARPVPVTIQPSAATIATKETTVPKPKPMTLAPDADAHPERCPTAGCTLPPHGRGLCNAHVQRAYREGTIDTLGLPSKTPYKAASARKPKAVAPTAPKPTPPTEPRLSREEKRIAAEQARQEETQAKRGGADIPVLGTLDKLHAERDAAIARAEAAEKALAIVWESLCADLGIEQSDDAEWVLGHLTNLINAEREGLDESIAVREALGIDPSGDYDLIARAREVMSELATVRAERDAAAAKLGRVLAQVCEMLGIDQDGGADWVLGELHDRIKSDAGKITSADAVENLLRTERAERIADLAKTLPWLVAAEECAAALGASTPDALLDAVRALNPRPGTVAQHEAKRHRVKQAGGRDLGILVGHVTESGLFRVTSGPQKGAAFGCLYSAEPVDRPVLGEPTPDRDVWVKTRIDEVTATHIYTADGGRFRRSEWGPDRFAPVAQSTNSSAVSEDDIPF